MKLLFVTSELYPYIKTGGLGDYSNSLPLAMHNYFKIDIKIMVPGYPSILKNFKPNKQILFTEVFKKYKIELIEGLLEGLPFPIIIIKSDELFNREGNPYVDSKNIDWKDNFYRFSTLGIAPYLLFKHNSNWLPEIVHANDWHSGLFSSFFNFIPPKIKPASVFTIHNIAFSGLFPYENFKELKLPEFYFNKEGLEYFGKICFLKAGINYSNKIITVSPNYREELLNNIEFGMGFTGILNDRKKDFKGILNGADYDNWSPDLDKTLKYNFNKNDLNLRHKQKIHFQEKYKLNTDLKTFLLTCVTRITEQKGCKLIIEALDHIFSSTSLIQFALVGMGDLELSKNFTLLAEKYPTQFIFINKYDETIAHEFVGSGDAFLMPSIFEPCGLTQFYAMKYGNVPIVTPVGGLFDTVNNVKVSNGSVVGNGFVCENVSTNSLIKTIKDAFNIYYNNSNLWNKIIINAMETNFSWEKSAKVYLDTYNSLIKN